MATVAPSTLPTSAIHYSDVVQYEFQPSFGGSKSVVVANEAAGVTYEIGQVLGKITASGKYRILKAGASDGSQNFAGIYVGAVGETGEYFNNTTVVPTTTDTEVVVLTQLAGVGDAYLKWDASITVGAVRNAVYAQMAAVHIKRIAQV